MQLVHLANMPDLIKYILQLYNHDIVQTFPGNKQFVIKNRSWSHLKAGNPYQFTFAGKYVADFAFICC